MAGHGNPWDIPEWHSVRRESMLIRQLIGSGATALGRANYADQVGEYYTAFFGLSVGLERLGKLILVADYAIANAGQMPGERVVRRFGHHLTDLLQAAHTVAGKQALKLDYPRPTDAISLKIVECLDAFADAGRGRYANFAALGDPNLGQHEPIGKWWGEVAELILKEHYYGKDIQKRVEGHASVVDSVMSPISLVLYINEIGEAMQDVLTSSIRTGQTELVQRFGRYYALTVVRWLSEIFSDLSRSACYSHNVEAFSGAWEYFQTYTVDDSFLKTRKNWPLA
ncbi:MULTISPECIES: hypothetical protein [unclassified Mesorhizobium]|uniref:hypothetical protein n=1 Tax=unclassified Mesorhizobium TaxID=325217 RepID=UPI000FCC6FF8|nr:MULTISPECIES: hypothetical protein [unclassified Mesorhizobium]RUU62927.1 hypothetical protein EOC99_16620 [Mesorhizobium sp. M7A.T.Ca.TU.009.01.1.1]RUU81163.1 hypothetical protein EOD03_17725 [Mesorhizobium sp. M7A.T.Ca.TU.009.01.1.2]RUT87465.1 hypothetical protein EOD14_10165 [Mesorhizobium sp. M7A.T.Ca.US.000.02.1.1]RUT90870.1 hypothetical protein EOD15_17105 [Mesorhizobium sp. M7A.T.Ca.US.000.02.2.1]RUT99898.1 hypothetical protein EOD12_20605 [Mesorhizobium sp. M7A.T.Ca.TU.009.02.1.1]